MNRLFLGAASLLFIVGLACGNGASEVSNTETLPKAQGVSEGPDDKALSGEQTQSRSSAAPSQQLEAPTLASFAMRQLAPGFLREGESYEIGILIASPARTGDSYVVKGFVKVLQVDESGWALLRPLDLQFVGGTVTKVSLFGANGEPTWVNLNLVLTVSEFGQ